MREQERSFSLLVAPNLVKLLYDLSSALMDETFLRVVLYLFYSLLFVPLIHAKNSIIVR